MEVPWEHAGPETAVVPRGHGYALLKENLVYKGLSLSHRDEFTISQYIIPFISTVTCLMVPLNSEASSAALAAPLWVRT